MWILIESAKIWMVPIVETISIFRFAPRRTRTGLVAGSVRRGRRDRRGKGCRCHKGCNERQIELHDECRLYF